MVRTCLSGQILLFVNVTVALIDMALGRFMMSHLKIEMCQLKM